MFIYSKKRIESWSYWRNRSMFLFSFTNGLIYASVAFLVTFFKRFFIQGDLGAFQSGVRVAGIAMLAGMALGIALWFINNKKYDNLVINNRKLY